MKELFVIIFLFFAPFFMFSQHQIHPDSLTGLKWKPDNLENSGRDYAVSPDLEYGNLSRREAVEALNNYEIEAVVLRYNEEDRIEPGIEDPWPREAFDTAAFNLIKEIKKYSPETSVYFWKRQWFNRNESQVDMFVDPMVKYIDSAEAQGFDDVVAGVCPIETNLGNSTQTLAKALQVAKEINKRTGGWLKDKTFFWPGAGMGQWFVNIDVGGETFFKSIQKECKHFAFIFKYMLSQPTHEEFHKNAEFEEVTTYGSKEEIQAFLRTELGLDDLKKYLSTWKDEYPRHANVIFWGDNGDGISGFMGRNNSKPVEATQELLLEEYKWGGNMFNLVIANQHAHPKRIAKSVLIEQNGVANPNDEVYDIWANWEAEQTHSHVEMNNSNMFRVYPNPAGNRIYYRCGDHLVRSVRLTDLSGKVLLTQTDVPCSGSIDLSGLTRGIYLLRLKTGNHVYTTKIMKD